MKMVDKVFEALNHLSEINENVSTKILSEYLNIDRTNVSRYLNELVRNKKIKKISGRPVFYKIINENNNISNYSSIDNIIGSNASLKLPISQAKAAILYPPNGLHSIILGETGVGKSMFAEKMFLYAKENNIINPISPFIHFNCADYTDNPQLLVSQIFGSKKGSYTGSNENRDGILKAADGGVLFLDEVHRLPPQGQEMLFTFIDKNYFKPLGENQIKHFANVRLICATTENPDSFLLKTFQRRIPMLIKLPSLKDRTLKERYELLEVFIKEESKRINKSIYIDTQAFIAYMLYECSNNIGQLKSDIQLACAKAFLSFKNNQHSHIIIQKIDLPIYVKKSLMNIKNFRNELNEFIDLKKEILRFNFKDDNYSYLNSNSLILKSDDHFYDFIEKKMFNLKKISTPEKEINRILNNDIEEHFKKYIGNINCKFPKNEILKIVDEKIVNLAEKILSKAEVELNRKYDEKVYLGLALHLNSTINRIEKGEKIFHPQLNFIRINYNEEFLFTMEIAKKLEEILQLQLPLDELGYISMFLATNIGNSLYFKKNFVKILILMHGETTASSMADVVNSLIGEKHAIGINMPLSKKPEEIYQKTKDLLKNTDSKKGVLFLVDMGSLKNFSDLIQEDLNIKSKSIDMVSTPIVLEACRKAILNRSLEEIYFSCLNLNKYSNNMIIKNKEKKSRLIITACFTGKGSSENLKTYVNEILNKLKIEDIQIQVLELIDKEKFFEKIHRLKEDFIIVCIVSTLEINILDIPLFTISEIFSDERKYFFVDFLKREKNFINIENSLSNHLVCLQNNSYDLINDLRKFIKFIENSIAVVLDHDVLIGLIIHMSFLIDRLKQGIKSQSCKDLKILKEVYKKEFLIIQSYLKNLEDIYEITFSDSDIIYICRIIKENK